MKRSIVYTAIAFSILLQGLPRPALAQIPSAETNAAPAAAGLNGVTYVAWKGQRTGPATVYFYPASNGSQAAISFAKTTQAPALAAQGNTLFLAWRGQGSNSTDNVYFSSYPTAVSSPAWSTQQSISFAETTAAPALASGGSTLYLAWTTGSHTIEVASYAGGVWTFGATQPPTSDNPYPGTGPALAFYGDTLFLAWLEQEQGTSSCGGSECYQVMYSTLQVSGSSALWSPAARTTAFSSVPVGPALGVYSLGGPYLAWTPSSGSLDYSSFDDGSWGTPVPVTGLPIPPGPLTPALVSNYEVTKVCPNQVVTYSFPLVYAAPVSGETYDDIYNHPLLPPQTVGACTCHGTLCQ